MSFTRQAVRRLLRVGSGLKRTNDFRRARRALCRSTDLNASEKRLVCSISLKVNPSDAMYTQGRAFSYLSAGLSASRCIQASLDSIGKTVSPGVILDFPCGYGRVLRFLKKLFPDSEIVGGDIEVAALDFCRRAFSVDGFLSQRDFRGLSLPRRFDMIWCGSLITHVDEQRAGDILDFFYRHLVDGGVCIFTTHGGRVAVRLESKELTFGLTEEAQRTILRDYRRQGYGFAEYFGTNGYGISVMSQSRIVELARSVGSWEQAHYMEEGWHTLQDVHAFVMRQPSAAAS
jgi:SAM-dependent methyltransferase